MEKKEIIGNFLKNIYIYNVGAEKNDSAVKSSYCYSSLEVLGLFLNSHMAAHNCLIIQFQKVCNPLDRCGQNTIN